MPRDPETNPPMPGDISERSRVSTRLGNLIGIIILAGSGLAAVINYTVSQREGMRDISSSVGKLREDMERELKALREEQGRINHSVWWADDMDRWAGRFRWENRAINLIVNEPRESRR